VLHRTQYLHIKIVNFGRFFVHLIRLLQKIAKNR
jgi:hypothetical protein